MSEFNRAEPARTWPAPGAAVAAAVLCEAEAWASAQRQLWAAAEAVWADWLHRHNATIDAGSHSLRQILDCRNPVELVRLQQQWVADTFCRAAADFGSLARDAAAVTERMAGADRAVAPAPDRSAGPRSQPAPSPEGAAAQRVAAE